MPAFTFEKITPPAGLEAGGPTSPPVRRGAIGRFVDRLTSARMKKAEAVGKADAPNREPEKRT